jgi:hypothetical protein
MIQTLSCEHGPSLAKCRWRTHRCNAGAALSVIPYVSPEIRGIALQRASGAITPMATANVCSIWVVTES